MSEGLQAILLANRATLLRFVAARGAGDDAEDVLQELWIKVSAAPSGPIANPLSYLFRAAENLMRDRHRASRQSILRDTAWDETNSPALPGVSDTPTGERVLIARAELARIEAALAAIGDRARSVFRLHRIEGLAQRDIATRMGVSLSTVEADMRKAYRAVAQAREKPE
ncbi:RNA polymerase sigma factor [Sphingomonas sp. CGMCC 1.13654]|uniref:RNA polymerase sigma factor n=1 Tax=Sphingomonas chungangi TaxID=2683589 RepID=A0A838LCK9_9SPHN|nr:RNA polymerase sigma factor [Sphingomonas chungangi]MBA2936465.1 RNA polymerase sigma factor [Sphingomonas chungangi]MVW55850.1 sigma-70 family RNA polymerase sigma factor [Sphingomonas chungangi]